MKSGYRNLTSADLISCEMHWALETAREAGFGQIHFGFYHTIHIKPFCCGVSSPGPWRSRPLTSSIWIRGLSSAPQPSPLGLPLLGGQESKQLCRCDAGFRPRRAACPSGRLPRSLSTSTLSLDGSQSGVRRGQKGDSERDPLLPCVPQPPAAPEICSLAP